ncbi:MAG: hypothetical protein IPI21_12305 [Propionivibrio sp.]|nr:hypothetical protein [Propionivibrio sp.]
MSASLKRYQSKKYHLLIFILKLKTAAIGPLMVAKGEHPRTAKIEKNFWFLGAITPGLGGIGERYARTSISNASESMLLAMVLCYGKGFLGRFVLP